MKISPKENLGENQDSEKSLWKQALLSVGLILSIPTTFAVPTAIGIYIDTKCKTSPIFFIIFGAFGIIAMAIDLYILWKRFGSNSKDE